MKKAIVRTVALGGTLLLGIGMGAATAGDDAPTAAEVGSQTGEDLGTPAEVTVTAPAPEPEVVTEEVEVEVEVTPQVCRDALDHADSVMAQSANTFDLASVAIEAAGNLDVDTINAVTAELERTYPEFERTLTEYAAARDECRSS